MTTNITSDFTYALMIVTAKRIARLAQTDKQAASNDFQQAAGAMDSEELAMFEQAVVKFAVEYAA